MTIEGPMPADPADAGQFRRQSDSDAAVIAAAAEVDRQRLKAESNVELLAMAARRKNSVNMLWETTQAFLAIALVVSAITSAFLLTAIPDTLTNALFVVLGFYFGRTNHARPTPTDPTGTRTTES